MPLEPVRRRGPSPSGDRAAAGAAPSAVIVVDPAEHGRAEPGGLGGEQVGAVQRPAGPTAGSSAQLAEVDALLVVGHARRQLAVEREPARATPARRGPSRSRALTSSGRAKNSRARPSSSAQPAGRYAVAGDPEEAEVAARLVDGRRHRSGVSAQVDERERGHPGIVASG